MDIIASSFYYYGDEELAIRRSIGRKYYTVTFTYDETAVLFAFDFAAKVRIWEDTGEPLDVIYGNGMGRNFLILSFIEQTKSPIKATSKRATKSIEVVPLEIAEPPKSIFIPIE